MPQDEAARPSITDWAGRHGNRQYGGPLIVGTNPKWRLGMCVEPLGVRLAAVVGLEEEVLLVVHIG